MNIQLDIDGYRNRFIEGQKSNLFFCFFHFPKKLFPLNIIKEKDTYPFFVKSANLPSVSIDEISTEIQFLTVKSPGFKTYGDWTITFNLDDKGEIYQDFLKWINFIQNTQNGNYEKHSFRDCVSDQELLLLDGFGNAVKTFKLYKAWPKDISEISLDYSNNEFSTFTVTFSYQYFTIDNMGNDSVSSFISKNNPLGENNDFNAKVRSDINKLLKLEVF